MRRLNGFSLMEMMIVLTIVAIVAAASAPMLNKKMVSSTEGKSWWEQVDNTNSIAYNFSGAGIDNNTVNIGGIIKNETNPPRLFIESKNTNPHIYFRNGDKNLKLTIGDNSINLKDTDEVMHAQSTIIGFGADTIDNASNSTAFGSSAKAANAATAFGESSTASGECSIAIGTITTASGARSIAIGSSNAIDTSTNATEADTMAIGSNANASKLRSTAIGSSAKSYIQKSTAIGSYAETGKTDSTTTDGFSTAIGYDAKATAGTSTAIGASAKAKAKNSIVIGASGAEASQENSIAIGAGANAKHTNAIAIGTSVKTTKDNQIVLGGKDHTVYIPGNLIVSGKTLLGADKNRGFVVIKPNNNSNFGVLRAGDFDGGDDNLRKHNAEGESWSKDYVVSSDRRLKNVGKAFKGGLAEIKKLEVFNYTFKNDTSKTPRVGVMAQDLKKIFPDAVIKGEDGFLKIRMEDMFYALVNAVKELDSRISVIEKQQKRIDELEKRIEALEQSK